MSRSYFISPTAAPAANWPWDDRNDARTMHVIIDDDVRDTGLVNAAGNKLFSRPDLQPVGFVHLRERA
jgi:hypothetical protein